MPICPICNKKLKKITELHLRYKHRLNTVEFIKRYPDVDRGMSPWNKGETKFSHPSVLKISKTMKAKPMSNFANWQKLNRKPLNYNINRSENLAELIGIILGDGNLYRHPRTENLRIICNSKDMGYIQHIAALINRAFYKKPSIIKQKNKNAVVISLYQCKITKRLNLLAGNKIKNNVGVPSWIYSSTRYMIKCLKGLFETDGCFQEDKANYAQYIEFKNNCKKLSEDVYNILLRLGFCPQFGRNYIRLARRSEAYKFKELIDFRNYN